MEGFYEFQRDFEHKDIEVFKSGGTAAHFHAQIEVLCVQKGQVSVTINGETKLMMKGDICVSGSYDVHSYSVDENDVAVVMLFPIDFLQRYFSMLKDRVIARHFLSDPKIYADICGLIDLYLSKEKLNALFKEGWANTVLGLLIDELGLKPASVDGKVETMREILAYIGAHYEEELTLKELSKKFGYSSHHFSRLFNAFANVSLKKYINSLRLESAADRLKSGESVTAAAFNSGFGSMRSFYRDFVEYYGETPQRYIRNNTSA